MPLKYIFSAFWEGENRKSLASYEMFVHAVLGIILLFTAKKWESSTMIVFSLVQGFLASMM
ncbi:MAG: hypothetical protein U5L96_11445 [Owenweeksia sp.]|nr:hypothetical protein [Owenweeksia sp.]